MFNDKYGLTRAVLEGHKIMTRRIITDINAEARLQELWKYGKVGGADWHFILNSVAQYKVGEEVAIAQRYRDIADMKYVKNQLAANEENLQTLRLSAGWNNKMFTKAYYMPNHIRMTSRRIERLQDISDDDCIREGVQEFSPCSETGGPVYCFLEPNDAWDWLYSTPREAFKSVLGKCYGIRAWDYNPWVVAYTFYLIR